MKSQLYSLVEQFAKAQTEGVKVWDFGEGVTTMPVPDTMTGSYLTSSMCVLYLEGKSLKDIEGRLLPRKDQEVVDYGHGWKFIAVEFFLSTTPNELAAKLEQAKKKLLGG